MDVRTSIKRGPMTRYQLMIIGVCLYIIAVDGFDVFAMGFVLPHLPAGFVDTNATKGYLLSAGLAGMAVGSFVLAPIADRIGRRRLVIICLVITLVGLTLSSTAGNVDMLIMARIVTGFGIGGLVPSLVVVVQEFSSDRRRGLVMGIYLTGMPLGSLIGGAIGTYVVSQFGGAWQSMFVVGAVLTAIALVSAILLVPESIDFLAASDTPRANAEIRRIAARLGTTHVQLETEPTTDTTPTRAALTGLFGASTYRKTLLLWVIQGMLMAAWYFLNSWTPQLVRDASGNIELGTSSGLILSLGGVLGSISFGLLSLRVRTDLLLWGSMALAAMTIVAFASTFSTISLAVILTVAVGLTVNAALTAVAAITPTIYPVHSRSTGTGWVLGIGRVCSILAPILVGYALAALSPQQIYYLAAIPVTLAAIAAFQLGGHLSRPAAVTPENKTASDAKSSSHAV
ncbi:MFS transporter [Rhodococcus erythropolis]|nr:MFS transporter [Rhodococcus erythropolis]